MPEFVPGESKTAIAPITVKPAGLNCEAEVFLGPDDLTKVATSGLVPFVSTGASQDVYLPVTMPSAEGTYHVFIDIYAEGLLIAAYQATEDVSIVAVGEPSFWMDPHLYYIGGEGACTWNNLYSPHFKARIENRGTEPGTFELIASYSGRIGAWSRSWSWPGWPAPAYPSQNMNPCYLTLGPGEAVDYEIIGTGFDCFAGESWDLTYKLAGGWPGNNVASGRFYGPTFPPIETYPY